MLARKRKLPLLVRRVVRLRAWELSRDAYKKYCESIEAALAAQAIRPEEVRSWTPAP